MRWHNDKHKEMKDDILQYFVGNLPKEDAVKINFRMLFNGIDKLFEELYPEKNEDCTDE